MALPNKMIYKKAGYMEMRADLLKFMNQSDLTRDDGEAARGHRGR